MYRLLNTLLIIVLSILGQPAHADTQAGLAALEQGKQKQAIELLKASENDPVAQVALAKTYLQLDLDEAEYWIEKALATEPDNAEVHYTLGIVRGTQAQNAIFSALSLAKKAKAGFEKAVELAPTNTVYLQGLLSYHLSAPSIAGGSLDEAEKLAARIESIEPIKGVIAKIDVAKAQDNEAKVLQLFEQALAEYTDSSKLAYQAGLFFQEQEDFDKAFNLFEQASMQKTEPEDQITHYAATYQLGRTAVFSGNNTQQGIQALVHYIDHAPAHADLASKSWAEFRLAHLYEQEGETNKAKAIYISLKNTDDKSLKKQVRKKI